MKIVVISDSHANIANLKHVMGFAKEIKAGAVIHCGDWNTLDSVETVTSFGIPLYAVMGNADIADNIKHKFKESLEFEIGGRKIGIAHKPNDIKRFFKNHKLDIIFHGHIHKKNDIMDNGIRVVNPGALENTISFAIYDTDTNRVEFIGL